MTSPTTAHAGESRREASSARVRPGARRDVAPLALAALALLSICPVLITEIPAMVDYPNHLARMSVLARAVTADANPHYEVAWALYPNLAMDLLVPPLARLVGVELATRLFYLAGQVLVFTGAVAVAAAAGGSRLLAALAASLVMYSIPFGWGFVNFEAALGLALWAIAGWIALRGRGTAIRLAAHGPAVGLLFLGHLFALGCYGAAVGLYELWRWRRRGAPLAALVSTAAVAGAPVAAVALLSGLLGAAVGGARTEWMFREKLTWLFFLNGYSREASMALTGALALLAYGLARSGRLRLVGAGPWLALGFAALYVATPFRLRDTAFVDVRVLVAAALILPAFVRLDLPAGRLRAAVLAAVGGAVAANLAVATAVQLHYRTEYRRLVSSFALLERGARVLVGRIGEEEDPPRDFADYPMHHAPTLAVHYADALVPTLFTYPGKQPVVTRASERHLAPPEGGPVPLALLLAAADGRVPASPVAYFAAWPRDFSYLYLLGEPVANPRPDLLEPLAADGRFTLYRVRGPQGIAAATRP